MMKLGQKDELKRSSGRYLNEGSKSVFLETMARQE